MNRYYVLVPVILLCLFSVVYWQHSKESAEQARINAEVEKKHQDDELAKKRLAEQRSREDADKHTAERNKLEADKKAEKQAKYEADIKKIKDEAAKYASEAAAFSKQAATLETDLANLRAAKEKANREAFELDKKVELAKIDRRNAELENQRFTEMLARRAAESSLAKPPLVTSAVAK